MATKKKAAGKAKTAAKPVAKKSAVSQKPAAGKKPANKKVEKSRSAQPPNSSKAKKSKASASITPLDNRVVVRQKEENTTSGGLILTTTEKPTRGTVLAIGRGKQDKKGHVHPMDVQIGDEVVFTAFSGSNIEWMGEKVLILREDEILGVIG